MLDCPYKKYFGIECPGCGAQTALYQVFQGKFVEAFHSYPVIYTLIILGIFILLNVFDKKRNYKNLIVSLVVLNVLIIFGVYFFKKF